MPKTVTQLPKKRNVADSLLSKSLQRGDEMLRIYNNNWKHRMVDCEPEVKKRKRT